MARNAADATIAILGGGAMGGSIARGLVGSGLCPAEHVTVCDLDRQKLGQLRQDVALNVTASLPEALAASPDVVLLALKPQVLPDVLAEYGGSMGDALAVSIAAGITVGTLEELLGEGQHVVRVMPNLPVAVRKGASSVCPGHWASHEDVELVCALFGALGTVAVLREDQLDAAGAVAGCAPAYFALMVDALTRAGVEAGLPADVARELSNTTMGGVAAMLDGGEHPRAYMEKVTSPGGTTAAALRVMEPLMEEACYGAVDAALARTYELAKGSR